MPARPRRRIEPWPVALAALLAAMVGTAFGFYRVAQAHPDPVIAQDSWSAEQAWAEDQRAIARAAARGWQLEIRTEPSPGGARVRLALHDRDGRPLAPTTVQLRRERPAEGGLDVDVPLGRDGDAYTAAVSLPRPGRWALVVRVARADGLLERTVPLWQEAR